MNVAVLMGRLTDEPKITYTQQQLQIARYTLAVDRRFKQENGPTADFIPCVAFGRGADFAEKYLHKGLRITVSGRIQTGSYVNKDGQKVYTTEVVVDSQEFADAKKESTEARRENAPAPAYQPPDDDFVQVPEGLEEELPFA